MGPLSIGADKSGQAMQSQIRIRMRRKVIIVNPSTSQDYMIDQTSRIEVEYSKLQENFITHH